VAVTGRLRVAARLAWSGLARSGLAWSGLAPGRLAWSGLRAATRLRAVAGTARVAAPLVPAGRAAGRGTGRLGEGGRAAAQFRDPGIVVERLVVTGAAHDGLLVADLVVAHALQARIGRERAVGTRTAATRIEHGRAVRTRAAAARIEHRRAVRTRTGAARIEHGPAVRTPIAGARIVQPRVVVPLLGVGRAAGLRRTGVTAGPEVRDRLRASRGERLLGAGHRVDAGRHVTLVAAQVGPGRAAVVRDLIPGHAAVAGAVGDRRAARCPRAPVVAQPGAAGGPAARPVVGGIGVARIPVVVYGRCPVAGPASTCSATGVDVVIGPAATGIDLVVGPAAVAGLQQTPGLRVQFTEAVGPGDVGTERHLAPSARDLVRLAASPRPVRARTAQGVILVGTLRR
jgi:hypothetical protein